MTNINSQHININYHDKLEFSDYFLLFKKITEIIESGKCACKMEIKVAVLSSFTIRGLEEILKVKCYEIGVICKFYIADYNQYAQEILDDGSGFYKFNPDLTIIFIDIRSLIGDLFLAPYSVSDEERRTFFNQKFNDISGLLSRVKKKSNSKIIFHNFESPSMSSLGILENKQEFGLIEAIENINFKLRDSYRNDNQVFIFDYNSFCSLMGKDNLIDYKMYYLADIKINFSFLPNLCNFYMSYVKPIMSLVRKCIILDLDNTLWGGIIGEDGMEGIKLGPTPEGRSFVEFQKYLLSLHSKGVIFAINSKNNYNDAMEVIKKHPHMVLREDHFSSIYINWNDKVSNIKEIAKDLNIGLNSLVFIDDDSLNRDMVRKSLPEVMVVDLPTDFSLYLKTIINVNDFNTLQITKEDLVKGKMYSQQRKRKEYESAFTDISDYLKGLKMVVEINELNNFNLSRISQLTQKTNQFNMTTRRYTEEDIRNFKDDLIISASVSDKFGDNGITGAVIIKRGQGEWIIDTFLLSCRIIGRKIEDVIFAYILNFARSEKVKFIVGEFISTKKNNPSKNFYKNCGFILEQSVGEVERWIYEVKKDFFAPDFIKLIKK